MLSNSKVVDKPFWFADSFSMAFGFFCKKNWKRELMKVTALWRSEVVQSFQWRETEAKKFLQSQCDASCDSQCVFAGDFTCQRMWGDAVSSGRSEKTHHWGKDHCMARLQFNKTGFDQKRKYVVICVLWSYWIQTCKTGDQPYSDPFPKT